MRSVLGEVLAGAALVAVTVGLPVRGYAAEQALLTAHAAATEKVDFEVFLPIEHRADLEKLLDSLHDPKSPEFHKWLKPAEFNARFGVSAAKLSAIESELSSHGLTVSVAAPRQLHVSGSAKDVEQAFASELKTGKFPSGKKAVAFSKPFLLPTSISAADGVVVGLSGKIRMQAHSLKRAANITQTSPDNRYSPTGDYWFTDLKQAYSFPSVQAYDGTGATVGILMAGSYLPSDMTKYFGHEKLVAPNVIEVPISGGAPFGGDGSFEAALDLQQSGGMAPGAQLVLVNVPDLSDVNFIAGLTAVVEGNFVDILSMSFGGPEGFYTAAYNGGQDYTGILQAFDDLFAQGNAQGITFVASSGDTGALGLPPLACLLEGATSSCGKLQVGVSFPASSPHVTAVGGTNLVTVFAPSSLTSAYVSENANDDPLTTDFYGTPATGGVWGSGGGDSIYFTKPAFQRLVTTGSPARTLPDVSMHMGGCPTIAVQPCGPDRSGDILALDGKYYGVVGTSASAPDFAGLMALKAQRDQSREGNANYILYVDAAEQRLGLVSGIFRENIQGYNGYYSTKPGYDRVLGIGTIRGLNFLQAPAGTPLAGVPQTPSNP